MKGRYSTSLKASFGAFLIAGLAGYTGSSLAQASTQKNLLEAEAGSLKGGVHLYADEKIKGLKSIKFTDEPNASVNWSGLPASKAITLTYAAEGKEGTMTILVNGKKQGKLPFSRTDQPNVPRAFKSVTYEVDIPEGGKLEILMDYFDTPLELDSVKLLPTKDKGAIELSAIPPLKKGKVEAETGAMFGETRLYDDAAASGAKGAAYLFKLGSSLNFPHLAAAKAVKVRYASAAGKPNGKISAAVNQTNIGDLAFESTPDWIGSYKTITYAVDIPEGGTFSLLYDHDDTAPNVDYIELLDKAPADAVAVSPLPPLKEGKIEAESAILSGKAKVYDDAAASGGKGIAYLVEEGSSLGWTNLAAAESVTIRYASPHREGDISIFVNGRNMGQIPFEHTSGWAGEGTYRTATYPVNIPEGATFQLVYLNGNKALNVDYIELHSKSVENSVAILPPAPPVKVDPFVYPEPDGLNKFEPEGQRVLVFVGQDNESVGGNQNNQDSSEVWKKGYIDAGLPMPAGISTYIAIADSSTNPSANVPEGFTIAGLHNKTEYGAGPVCLKCYLDKTSALDKSDLVVHLSIYYADPVSRASEIAAGKFDTQIREIAAFIKSYPHIAFMVRPGYEFDGQYQRAGVEAKDYIGAFRRVGDLFKEEKLNNVALVFSSESPNTEVSLWESFYPGNDYVDWIGFSVFLDTNTADDAGALVFAKGVDKPVFIAEAAFADKRINEQTGQEIWDKYFTRLLELVKNKPDLIKGIAYINTDWTSQPLWENVSFFDETDSRIQQSTTLKSLWEKELSDQRYILGDDNVLEAIGFNK